MEYSEGWQGYSERFSEMEYIEAVNSSVLGHQHFQPYISLGELSMYVCTYKEVANVAKVAKVTKLAKRIKWPKWQK